MTVVAVVVPAIPVVLLALTGALFAAVVAMPMLLLRAARHLTRAAQIPQVKPA